MVRGGLKLEIKIPSQRIRAKQKGGLINEGGVMSSEYDIIVLPFLGLHIGVATLMPPREVYTVFT